MNNIKQHMNGHLGNKFIGNSPEAKRINRAIKKMSKADANILLIGDSGAGKEHVARLIHSQSARKNKPFVQLNCSALGYTIDRQELFGNESDGTDGIFEKANKGVLFLDNISETPAEFQFDLLQSIREKKYRKVGGSKNIDFDVRIISATSNSIDESLATGDFRKELYYLLKSLTISLPTLKERKQDIPELFIYFVKTYCQDNQLEIPAVPAEIFESILEYDWKGNVLELKNCVENLVMMSPNGELSTEFMPFEVKRHPLDSLEVKNLKGAITEVETYFIKKALGKFAGNQVKAAKLLGVPEATLRFKMKKYAIPKD